MSACPFFAEHRDTGSTPCPCGYPNRPQDKKEQRLADLEDLLTKAKAWREAQIFTLSAETTRDAVIRSMSEGQCQKQFWHKLNELIMKDKIS